MNRSWLLLGLAMLVLTLTGCQACKQMFGLDRRCEAPPPQPQCYSAPPMAAPANYAPAPCNAPK